MPCICQILNTLIPFRRFPGRPVNCDDDSATRNCQQVDFCCPFSKLGFLIGDSLKFINRALVSLWQPWTGGLPEFFLGYIFCTEGTPPRCPYNENNPGATYETMAYQNVLKTQCELEADSRIPDCTGTLPVVDKYGVTQMKCGKFTCGRLHIVIRDLADPYEGLLARCTCQFFGLLDRLLALFFRLIRVGLPFAGWSCCFCGGLQPGTMDCLVNGGYQCDEDTGTCEYIPGGACTLPIPGGSSGIFTAISYLAQAVLFALTNLIRQFPFACYWKPFPSINSVEQTWIFSFLGEPLSLFFFFIFSSLSRTYR